MKIARRNQIGFGFQYWLRTQHSNGTVPGELRMRIWDRLKSPIWNQVWIPCCSPVRRRIKK